MNVLDLCFGNWISPCDRIVTRRILGEEEYQRPKDVRTMDERGAENYSNSVLSDFTIRQQKQVEAIMVLVEAYAEARLAADDDWSKVPAETAARNAVVAQVLGLFRTDQALDERGTKD